MKYLLTILTVILTGFSSMEAQEKQPKPDAKALVQEFPEIMSRMLDAVKSTKTEDDLKKLDEVVTQSSVRMTEIAKELGKLGPFDETATRSLWSVFATREYEVIGDNSMEASLQASPKELQEKIMKIFESKMEAFMASEEALGKHFKKNNPGPTRERVRLPLEQEFVAAISTAHKQDTTADPAIAIVFHIFADQKDGSSVILFEQVIPWAAAKPTEEELKKWISYSKETREVTFKHPTGSFTHPLPKKR